MGQTLTTCTFCGVGCGLYLETSVGKISGVYPSMSHPTNQGRICVRGWNVHEVSSATDRLRTPLLKKNGKFEPVSYEEAVEFIVKKITEIKSRYGSDAFAFLCSPRCSNEESYLLQKFARTVIGTNNVDHGTGVYVHNSINVLMDMLGVAGATNSISELDRSEVIIVDGVDLARQLPTIGGRVIRAKLNGAKLIVIDSRRHRITESADIFLRIKPGTEALLYGAMCKIILDRGLMNFSFIKEHCENFNEFISEIQNYDLAECSKECCVDALDVERAAVAYATAKRAALLYSTGIESRRIESIQASVNLVLFTGQLGKAGSGIYPLTEHNNLQGVCDMGMLPDRLPGYCKVDDDAGRRRLEILWGKSLPKTLGLTARNALSDAADGKIKAVWLCRYDPVSTAFFADAAKTLSQMELVVVQHLFKTATAEYADVILPTTAYGEEDVTFTNTERRIQLVRKAIEPLKGTMPAWEQIVYIAKKMGENWQYTSSADVMNEIGMAVPFYSGATYDNLAQDYGRQWPCTKDNICGTPTLFADKPKFYSSTRFKFCPLPKSKIILTKGDDEYPLQLYFGHSLYYWHQNVLIKHSETLKREYRILLLDYPQGFVEISVEDAKKYGIRDGSNIRIVASTGSAVSTARVTNEVREGTVFVPYFVREVSTQILGRAGNGYNVINVRLEKIEG